MQSPSEPEFVRTAEDLMSLESVEQEVYCDVRLRAAYTRYRIYLNKLKMLSKSISSQALHGWQIVN